MLKLLIGSLHGSDSAVYRFMFPKALNFRRSVNLPTTPPPEIGSRLALWPQTNKLLLKRLGSSEAYSLLHFGVVVAVVVAPAALLFLLPFLSLVGAPGVTGLFSPALLPFLPSFASPVVCICFGGCALNGVAAEIIGFGTTSFGLVTRKDPGSPTRGLESMYSLP